MILDGEIELLITNRNIKYYRDLGYLITGKRLKIDITHLPISSKERINVKCDICGFEKSIVYHGYIHNTKNFTEDYCCCQKCAVEKHKKTCLKNLGVEHALQNKCVQNKFIQTCLTNNGVEHPQQSAKIRIKSHEVMIEKYGVKYAMQGEEFKEKYKQTCLDVYGVENAMKNKDVQLKSRETCLKNNGVKYPTQNAELFEKLQKSGKKTKKHELTGLNYQGTYEKDFLDYCFNKDIKVEKIKSIKYEFEQKQKIYYPDFYVKEQNLIIEIKSNYYYNKFLEQNLEKQKACLLNGFNFMFIIDKNYNDFKCLIGQQIIF